MDLNAFLRSLGEHTEGQSAGLSRQSSLTDAIVVPRKLKLLLEGECAVVACRGGSYMEPFATDGEALRSAGWDTSDAQQSQDVCPGELLHGAPYLPAVLAARA